MSQSEARSVGSASSRTAGSSGAESRTSGSLSAISGPEWRTTVGGRGYTEAWGEAAHDLRLFKKKP